MHPHKISKHDAIITLGDFNAKLGREQLCKDIIGRHRLHDVTNNNGLRLVQYATTNSFKVLSTWFPRKGTWKIAGTNYTNKIDHILVSEKWASDIRNVLTYRGANSDFDHVLVEVRLKQKMTRNRTVEISRQFSCPAVSRTLKGYFKFLLIRYSSNFVVLCHSDTLHSHTRNGKCISADHQVQYNTPYSQSSCSNGAKKTAANSLVFESQMWHSAVQEPVEFVLLRGPFRTLSRAQQEQRSRLCSLGTSISAKRED